MAEQKKERAKAAPRKTATKRKTTTSSRTVKTNKSDKAPKIRKEVRGLFTMLFAVVALLGIFNITSGTVVDIIAGIFKYGFGIGGLIPCLYVGYVGWRILYADKGFSITRRGLLLSLVYLFAITLVTLLMAGNGEELMTTKVAAQGGVLGGMTASLLRSLLGNVGAILVTIVVELGLILLIYQISLRTGLHKAKAKTDVGLEKARVLTEETVQHAKERYADWKEEQTEKRRIYNQEKDTRFSPSAAVEVLTNAAQVSAEAKAKAQEEAARIATEEQRVAAEAEAKANLVAMGEQVDLTKAQAERIDAAQAEAAEFYATVASETSNTTAATNYNEPASNDEDDELEVPPFLRGRGAGTTPTTTITSGATSTAVAADTAMPMEANPATVGVATDGDDASGMVATDSVETEAVAADASTINNTESETDVIPVAADTLATSNMHPVPTLKGTEEDTAAVAVTVDGKPKPRRIELPYHFPPLAMLAKGQPNQVTSQEVTHNVTVLEETLKSFGVIAHVVNATQGPTVTRYELEPAPGTKVSKILNLTDDLKMALAAIDIRIEAPIPGKSAVGIEVPNKNTSAVHLRDVLESEKFQKARGGIPVGLGKDIAGEAVITDLAKMPHLLVAGSTGSGKSVCVNTLISSILFSRKPSEVQLILVDPKMVELSVYNGIPHLKVPVVTDMKKAAAVLRWAVREMEARYLTMATSGVRNISGYNEQYPESAMPLILIIIDELADLMLVAPDVEESINRLAAKARAAGIHMVLATQRPSVNVITGTIKANVPSRISFAVATQIDSRTILDMAGAEKLLGKGDMLFNPIGASKPIRIQGAFISDEEVEELVAFVKQQGRPDYDESITEETEQGTSEEAAAPAEERDELLERAIERVMSEGQASTSMLQRRFRIGYSRAARLVDTMEEMKIIGPANGSKPRDILMTPEEVKTRYFS
ncbi:DNA translocase FtsK 4TM domain-containing protein [uncultured Veillonella sp.]|uniref:FtsK/SpoIIIE family DNA translocase n=1 Tax=uncultured Veillonella sp. TaxID=159268 RepID=UPI00280BABE2|nr:DNA translocase FtsK 4TM domain-containing protein [uncultured Veillonella sp.]